MAIKTLLEHLQNTQKTVSIKVGPVTLNDTRIDDYSISQSSLWIVTNDNNEIEVDIGKFLKIDFDTIPFVAKSSLDMYRCFSDLFNFDKYNAYIRDENNHCILGFCKIPSDY